MPDITTIQAAIVARLTEVERLIEPLRLEAEQLAKMVASFDGHTIKATPATRSRAKATQPARKASAKTPRDPERTASAKTPRAPSAPAPARRGRRVGSGDRAQQAVAKITEQPGITVSELAKAMGINANYLYRVLPQLERDAKITKQGKGYHPAGDAQASAPPNGQPVPA